MSVFVTHVGLFVTRDSLSRRWTDIAHFIHAGVHHGSDSGSDSNSDNDTTAVSNRQTNRSGYQVTAFQSGFCNLLTAAFPFYSHYFIYFYLSTFPPLHLYLLAPAYAAYKRRHTVGQSTCESNSPVAATLHYQRKTTPPSKFHSCSP